MSATYKSSIKIVSGGQTGVDRAALDFALQNGFAHGGWCPRGRIAEDGRIPERYLLTETPGSNYPERTRKNVMESDGTLIIVETVPLSSGTRLTEVTARRNYRPILVVTLRDGLSAGALRLRQFIEKEFIKTLNVAGPRLSSSPSIEDFVHDLLAESLLPQ